MLKRNPDKFLCPSNYIANVQYYLQKNDIMLSGDPFILLDAKNFETLQKSLITFVTNSPPFLKKMWRRSYFAC